MGLILSFVCLLACLFVCKQEDQLRAPVCYASTLALSHIPSPEVSPFLWIGRVNFDSADEVFFKMGCKYLSSVCHSQFPQATFPRSYLSPVKLLWLFVGSPFGCAGNIFSVFCVFVCLFVFNRSNPSTTLILFPFYLKINKMGTFIYREAEGLCTSLGRRGWGLGQDPSSLSPWSYLILPTHWPQPPACERAAGAGAHCLGSEAGHQPPNLPGPDITGSPTGALGNSADVCPALFCLITGGSFLAPYSFLFKPLQQNAHLRPRVNSLKQICCVWN